MKVVKTFTIKTGKNGRGKTVYVGSLLDTGLFRKNVKSSIHMLKKNQAYGISAEIFEELRELKCKVIEIYDSENKLTWYTPFNLFESAGWNWSYSEYETQKFLEKKWWNIKDEDGTLIQKGKTKRGLVIEEYSPQLQLI